MVAVSPFGKIQHMTIDHKISVILLVLALGACSSSPPPKAPGTNPGDMSADEHEKKAMQHEQMAVDHEDKSDSVGSTGRTPLSEEAARKQHQSKADQEKDIAKQHSDAADKAAKP